MEFVGVAMINMMNCLIEHNNEKRKASLDISGGRKKDGNLAF